MKKTVFSFCVWIYYGTPRQKIIYYEDIIGWKELVKFTKYCMEKELDIIITNCGNARPEEEILYKNADENINKLKCELYKYTESCHEKKE